MVNWTRYPIIPLCKAKILP